MSRLLLAEWTKFRTVPGWVAGTVAAALMIVLVAVLAGMSGDQKGTPPVPVGPAGEPVSDSFFFVHRPLTGDGSITVSVSSLSSSIPAEPGVLRSGRVPWAKAGLIIKQSTRPGSPYAAIMVTASHGVRMQDSYVNDAAGPRSAAWLRLTRAGDTITGSSSDDGIRWNVVGAVHVAGLETAALGGLFVASPPFIDDPGTRGSVSTAVFADLRTRGLGEAWTGAQVGAESPTFAGYPEPAAGSFTASAGRVTVTGAGDIAPATRESLPTGGALNDILTGTFVALIALAVLGALVMTTEYRDNLIHVTMAASPARSGVLLAKAAVLGCATLAAGLAGAVAAVPLGRRLSQANGVFVFPVTRSAELRVVLGTAALLAAVSILALSAGAIFRTSSSAVTAVIAGVVLPYLLIANPFMPASVANWLARVTPVAAFAVQQTLMPYPQVASIYTPYDGYYPLAPWSGLAVLGGYALVSLIMAAILLDRRDA